MTQFRLSPDEISFFHANGFLGPFNLCTVQEMAAIRAYIEQHVLTTAGPNPKNPLQCRHLDDPEVFRLCSHPSIVDRMKSLYGPDLVLWASYFFAKDPGGKEIPWHQDLNYWPLEPVVNISAWLAIDKCTPENSCVRIIPASHKRALPHVPAPGAMAFQEMADLTFVDESKALDMPLDPGQFFLFNEKLLHQSHQNRSNLRRIGLSMRVTIPFVKITHDHPLLFPGHAVILLAGQDHMKFNRTVTAPTTT